MVLEKPPPVCSAGGATSTGFTVTSRRPSTSTDCSPSVVAVFFGSLLPSSSVPFVEPMSTNATPCRSKRMTPCHSDTNGSSMAMSFSWFRPIRTGDSENRRVSVAFDATSLT